MKYCKSESNKRWLVALLAIGVTLGACAKRESEDLNVLEQKSLDAWIAKYVTGRGIEVVRQSNGMWVEFIEDGDQTIKTSRDTIMWVQLHYTSTDINSNVFATRDSMEALRQGSFTPYTYYAPEFVWCGDQNYQGMPEGYYYALKRDLVKPDGSTMKLSKGSHVKLYLPPHLAYESTTISNDQGYGGQYPLGSTQIVIQDLTVKGVVENPLEYEEILVMDHAIEQWGKALTDTIAPGLWLDTVNFHPKAELLDSFPNKPFVKEYSLTADSTAHIWYVCRFLPTPEYPKGFVLDTNIPTIYEEFYNRRKSQNYVARTKSFAALEYNPNEDQESLIAAFFRTIPRLRKGQWSRIVFPSTYGYGATGDSKAVREEQEYTNQILQYYQYSSMYNMYGGYGGYDSYGYGYGYNDYGYYDPYYYNYMPSSTTTTSDQTVITEVAPYTPLIFELYIEAEHDE